MWEPALQQIITIRFSMNRYINLDIAENVARSQVWCDKRTFMAPSLI